MKEDKFLVKIFTLTVFISDSQCPKFRIFDQRQAYMTVKTIVSCNSLHYVVINLQE